MTTQLSASHPEAREKLHAMGVPLCTCGKCVVVRVRKDLFEKFPYRKNLASSYGSDFDWKNADKNPDFYNRSKHTGFEGSYREHLPSGLISTMKFDYKPFRVQREHKVPEEHKVISAPFFARTTNQVTYPNWGSMNSCNEKNTKLPEIRVPFRGNSNYAQNYGGYDPEVYKNRNPLLKTNPTLEFYGKFKPDTTFNTSFKPIDLNQPHYFNRERVTKTMVEGKSSLEPANFPKSNFESLYSRSYIDYKDFKCPLHEHMKKSGTRTLEI